MHRRDFISGLGGTAIWSLSARAQQSRPARKIGVPVNFLSREPEGQARTKAFTGALRNLGWIEGENLHTEIRYAATTTTAIKGSQGNWWRRHQM
jgi:putative ABC transport system substrate-binding protein